MMSTASSFRQAAQPETAAATSTVTAAPPYVGGSITSGNRNCSLLKPGDAANTAARLASAAQAGEILVSETCLPAGAHVPESAERRELELKGRAEALPVRVLRVTP